MSESEIEFKSIKELLKMKFFIPSYQRGYRWTEQQVRDLLNDVDSYDKSKDGEFYCLQPLVVCQNGNNSFNVIDGQQRLTTLYLLYLYAVKAKKENFNDVKLEKFTYDTRHAAKDFCKAVVENDWSGWSISNKPSESIKNCTWFMDYWQYDPTVEGMLTMLDAIHEKAKSGFYPELDKITFFFFDMDEHGLDENLYLKMNSRGKPLTAFENLKADIDSMLPENIQTDSFDCLENNEVCGNSFSEKWKYYIDRDWTDFFWKYKDENNLVDSAFIRFIANTLACYWAVNKKQNEEKGEIIKHITESESVFSRLTNLSGNEDFIDFSIFKSALELDDAFAFLARTLSIFSKFHDSIDENSSPSWKEDGKSSISEEICRGDITNKIRAIFFAVASYPRKDFENNSFKHWMRVIWNIVENANLNGVSELRLINKLSEEISQKDIYEVLNTKVKSEVKESDFASEQVKEECEKAKKILESHDWEAKIIEAEGHEYLRGKISVLFQKQEENSINSFTKRLELLNKLLKNEDEYHIIKVMLSYLPDNKVPDYPNCLYLRKTNEYWKRLLTKDLFDEFQLIPNNGEKKQLPSECWLNKLVETMLLNNCRGKVLTKYAKKYYVMWGTEGLGGNAKGCVLLNYEKNNIFAELVKNDKIEIKNEKVPETDTFIEWNIEFVVKESKEEFYCYWNDDKNIYKRKNNEIIEIEFSRWKEENI